MPQPFSSADWTTILAIWGAILSTLLATKEILFAIRELRKEKRRIRLICTIGAQHRLSHEDNPLLESRLSPVMLRVQVLNVGYRPVNLLSAGLAMTNGYIYKQTTSDSAALPLKLNDGDRVEINFELTEVKEALAEQTPPTLYAYACVRDAEGQVYKGQLPKQWITQGMSAVPLRQQWLTHSKMYISAITSFLHARVARIRWLPFVIWGLILFPWQAASHAVHLRSRRQEQAIDNPPTQVLTESARKHSAEVGDSFSDELDAFDDKPDAITDYKWSDDVALFQYWHYLRYGTVEERLQSFKPFDLDSDNHKRKKSRWTM